MLLYAEFYFIWLDLHPKFFQPPKTINTDKYSAYNAAINNLKEKGEMPENVKHRKVKYLNNRIESDHGKLKRLIKPTLGFKALHSARATIAGFEVMRMLKKGQIKGVSSVNQEIALVTTSLSYAYSTGLPKIEGARPKLNACNTAEKGSKKEKKS